MHPGSTNPADASVRLKGFSVLELLVAMAVLSLLLIVLISITGQTTKTIKYVNSKIEAYAAARAAQDLVSQRLSQATLNTYWDYYANGARRNTSSPSNFKPDKFGRASDLHFVIRANAQTPAISGQEIYFQTPEAFSDNNNYRSTQGLLNACGYFIRYGSDADFRPNIYDKAPRYRYRLMQAIQPTENLDPVSLVAGTPTWINSLQNQARPIADNIVAMVVWPRLSALEDPTGSKLAPQYSYNTKGGAYNLPTANQLPPTVELTFIVISEASAAKIDTKSQAQPVEISSVLTGKFIQASVNDCQRDLEAIEVAFQKSNIDYRIMSASIVLRESKWSNN